MRSFISYLIIFCTLTITSIFGWGEQGHKLIAAKGVELLPKEMALPASYGAFVVEHSVDPDNRKAQDKTEGPKHFIDIDFYKEYNNGTEVLDQEQMIAKYKDTVTRQGTLPWATLVTYKNLVDAMKSGSPAKIKLYMADLAHYIGDAHQPMHTIMNYNGQLSGQKNIHFRYESDMVDTNLSTIASNILPVGLQPIKDLRSWLFAIVHESNCLQPVLFAADKLSYAESGNQYNNNYYRLLWFYTKFVTIDQFTKASNRLAQVYYFAWVEAGKPKFTE
jgi:hypothetical protein